MMRLSEAARVLHAQVRGSDIEYAAVGTDTRSLKPNALFVALRGERYDGHDFLKAAQSAGAAAAMVDSSAQADTAPNLPLLIVPDTRRALGELAANWRGRFTLPVVALTGSSGKTSVKEMLAAILRYAAAQSGVQTQDAVLATRGNLNNDIGLPLMLLELASTHQYAVIEMGMNHAGEIRYLCGITNPDVGLITNAGRAHIEYLGSEEAIARAKGELFEAIGPDATVVINADDRFTRTRAADGQGGVDGAGRGAVEAQQLVGRVHREDRSGAGVACDGHEKNNK
jgi:UDP-N-acetylmuramoyl-tripeptide--D-alanyl-D-alanine ligase